MSGVACRVTVDPYGIPQIGQVHGTLKPIAFIYAFIIHLKVMVVRLKQTHLGQFF